MIFLRKVGRRFFRSKKVSHARRTDGFPKTGLIEVERLGFKWRLDMDSCISRAIVEQGIWEPDTTRLVQDFVKEGMYVLDVGANFGYFTLILARSVGPAGRVWAFEPVTRFRNQLRWHLEQNGLESRVTVFPFGLSDKEANPTISLDASSATLHWTGDDPASATEVISLVRLDDIADKVGIRQIDFIKLDIDGHEPQFLRGASTLLRRAHPPIALEFAQHCLHIAGSDVREQARVLNELGYVICNEKTRNPYPSEMQFLMECGNFDHSCNALALSRTAR